jgi:hypothetical protein
MRVFSRIRPLPADCDKSNLGIGRDHLWIFESEVDELLAAARAANRKPFPMPNRITGRLVRFQLLDTVRNVSPAFSEGDVKKASFMVEPSIGQDGMSFSFYGQYDSQGQTEDGGQAFGITGWLQGEFRVDAPGKRIEHFRAYGEATASGHNNGGAPEGDYPVVFAVIDAYDDISRAVPPLYFDISPVWRAIYRNPKLPSDGRDRP